MKVFLAFFYPLISALVACFLTYLFTIRSKKHDIILQERILAFKTIYKELVFLSRYCNAIVASGEGNEFAPQLDDLSEDVKKSALTHWTPVLTQVIKQVAHRHRPYQDNPPNPHVWDGPFSWGGDYGTFGYNSFPSGHSSTAFSIATVIALEYWDTKWVPIVCFGLAGLTAAYRLAMNDHWASDVIFGSALGFAVGSMVYFNTNKKLQIIPVSSTGIGATLIYNF